MDMEEAILALAALAQTTRLAVFRLLVMHEPEGLPAGDIAQRLAVPQNTLSSHLGALARAGLVSPLRQGRSIVYRARIEGLSQLTTFLTEECCGGRPGLCAPTSSTGRRQGETMTERVFNVLFLCTGNSARSILAEAMLAQDGKGRFRAFSAGSQPKGQVNPMALKVLADSGYGTEGLRSKSWDEFALPNAPVMDFVFTVCDSAAGEACPIWPGTPITAHWGIDDPAGVEGSALDRERAFVLAQKFLKNRLDLFRALPITTLDAMTLQQKLDAIGKTAGASSATGAMT